MAASINFYAGGFTFPINNLTGSGLGFFGSGGFGQSVDVSSYQDTTFITDGNGVSLGPQVNNVKWVHSTSGQLTGSTNVLLTKIPNYQSTLNVRLTNSTAVKTQFAQLYIYDRTSINNAASGVTCAVAHIIHPDVSQSATGSGDSSWQFPSASSYVPCSNFVNGVAFSPGISGQSVNGGSTTQTDHDWYFAISASPNSIGSKTQFGLYFSTQYL